MPLYEYKCGSCGEVLEVRQKFSDEPLKIHEQCGGPLEKLISRSSVQFKGTGWYVTDYAKGNGKKSPSQESGQESKTESAGEKKTESAGEKKSESKAESKSEKSSESKSDKEKKSSPAAHSTSSAAPAAKK